MPDVEDINQDNTLNETEKYFQYRVRLAPTDLKVGQNYITDKRTVSVRLRNGQTEEVTWYQSKYLYAVARQWEALKILNPSASCVCS